MIKVARLAKVMLKHSFRLEIINEIAEQRAYLNNIMKKYKKKFYVLKFATSNKINCFIKTELQIHKN